jgi:hypothetical protein
MYTMKELDERLMSAISMLPRHIKGDKIINLNNDVTFCPVMRNWTTMQPLRVQGVIVSALRGCDGAPKDDPSKSITSLIRRAVMNPADDRETTAAGGFFGFESTKLTNNARAFLHSLDHYPLHYITHLMHACQIIGYEHPEACFRLFFETFYTMMVFKFHLNVESQDDMRERLCQDRIALGTVESDIPKHALPGLPSPKRSRLLIWPIPHTGTP